MLPKIVFILAFSYDVLVQKHLHYTFICLPFLLLTLLEKFLLFVFQDFYDINWNNVSSYVKQTTEETSAGPLIRYELALENKYNIPFYFGDFKQLLDDHYLVLEGIGALLTYYKFIKREVFPYYQICLGLCIIRLLLLIFILVYGTI